MLSVGQLQVIRLVNGIKYSNSSKSLAERMHSKAMAPPHSASVFRKTQITGATSSPSTPNAGTVTNRPAALSIFGGMRRKQFPLHPSLRAISLAAVMMVYCGFSDAAVGQTTETQADKETLRATIAKARTMLMELEIKLAELDGDQPGKATEDTRLQSATAIFADESKRPVLPRPNDMPSCDAPGADGSIGSYMLDLNDTDRQKKESSYDESEIGTNEGINAFVYHCQGLTRASDYESTTNLSAQFTASKGNDQIDAAITRTARAVKKANADGSSLAASYNRYSLGGFGRTGSDGSALLIDLTESNFASGVGVVAGFEWGQMRAQSREDLKNSIHRGIAKARQECVLAHSIIEPLTLESATPAAQPYMSPDPVLPCKGNGLVKWMAHAKRGNKYWTDIVAPLWGYNDVPEKFAGVQFRYAFQDLTYRPVIDPKTGAVIATTLPDAVNIHPEPYSAKLYGGFNLPVKFDGKVQGAAGLTASLTYRREVDFIGGTSGKTICTPAAAGATFDICTADQKLAAPYDTKGFVGGIALNLQSRRFWYLPKVGISPRLTYAFDTKRLGVEVPLFLFTDSDGKLNSGIKYTCRFRGETPEGVELKKSCGVNLFFGTSFELGKTP